MVLSKQLVCQKYIFKINSERLRNANWNLTLSIPEARRSDEIVSLADSQVLRWLDELNGITGADERAREIKAEIRRIRREDNSIQNRARIRQLYDELDALQFKPDYMCMVIDRERDYRRACRGFRINGIRYVRLLGTTGGVKMKTIVFIAERHAQEIRRRIENGRDPERELVPAKLEAYRALTCSASVPVSLPKGILVVDECITHFTADVLYLDDGEDEPIMEHIRDFPVELDASDGYGLMLPCLAERWSQELNLGYTTCGMNTRFSWEKGMVFTFDFIEFAERVAGTYTVKDAWGVQRDIRDAELILTTSMLKLWDSYPSLEAYLANCQENGYTFGITKTCPETLENERTTNYQYLNPYHLSDEDVDELLRPTMEEFHEVLSGDSAKTILFLRGKDLCEKNVQRPFYDYTTALMIEPKLAGDPYVRSRIYQTIKNKIDEAKVGVLKVHGNYSIISGDPYALCQSMFGLEVTGLLKAGELYNEYWRDSESDRLACFRSPMSCANNIRILSPNRSEEAKFWYRYMTTCTILNAWDTTTHALNGCDFDGDLVMLTDNRVLVECLEPTLALVCAQKKAPKCVPTEADAIQSNINGFGDDIGKITNRVTTMYDIQSTFAQGSREYETLEYRIMAGQKYQQDSIDRVKGIVSKPMSRSWYDYHSANKIEEDGKRTLYRSILAEKKPYFMRYIYPDLMKQYNTYIKSTEKKAKVDFSLSIQEMSELQEYKLTKKQRDFLHYYRLYMPTSNYESVTNRVCRRFEEEFDHYTVKHKADKQFDYTVMKSGAEYSRSQFYEIAKLYREYNRRLRGYSMYAKRERVEDSEVSSSIEKMKEEFMEKCEIVCPNEEELCDIVLDICYKKNGTKRFAWEMCAEQIIRNLLKRRGGKISYPTRDENGSISYGGQRFSMRETIVDVKEDKGVIYEYCTE